MYILLNSFDIFFPGAVGSSGWSGTENRGWECRGDDILMTQKYLAFLCKIKVPLAGVNLILCRPSEVTDGDQRTDAKNECVPHIRVTFLKYSPGCFIPLMSFRGFLCPQDKLHLCHWTPQPFTAHASIINLLPLHSPLRAHCSHPVVPHASAAQVSCTLSSSSQAWPRPFLLRVPLRTCPLQQEQVSPLLSGLWGLS